MNDGSRRAFGTVARPLGSVSPALVIALLPKCPACLGAYLALASSVGLDQVRPGVLQAVAIGCLVLAMLLLGRAANRRHRWVAYGVACAGASVVVGARLLDAGRTSQLVGVGLLYAGALRIYLGRRRACPST